jgi:ATP-dependent RNA helicase RhlE
MPPALAGRDVLGIAQTGTGKTAAFVLPILQRLLGEGRAGTRALVVTPTRELAAQVNAEFERLARYTPLTSAAVFGGVPVARQVQALRARPEVVVACPGRLLDLLNRGCLRLDRIEVLVLDEADHMLDMGFLPDVRRLLEALPRHRQTLLFSATMPREIRRLADSVLRKPAVVELAHSQPAETIDHAIFSVAEGQKVGVLELLFGDGTFRSAIVFLRTKRRTKRLAQQLGRGGHQVVTLQGNMSQAQRGRALRGFREGRFDVLVATDIAARGLDIAGVSHVVNFDVPNTPDAYTHRVGRTGRSGLAGTAFTLATPGDGEALRAIEKRFGKAIPRRSLEGLGLPGNAAHGGTEARHASKPPRGRRPGRAPRLRAPGVPPIQEAAPAEPAVFGQGVTDVPSRLA